MSNTLHNQGEEQILEVALENQDLALGLYNESTDQLADNSTLGDITTEPDNAESYSRVSISGLNVTLNGSGDAEAVAPEVIFNVSSNTETVDAVFVVNTDTNELQFTSELDETRDLEPIDNLVNNNIGLTLD